LLDQLEQSIENLTSNQYNVTAEATEDENGEESYLINIERIVDDPVIAGEEEGNGDEDGGNGDEEDGGNGDEEDGGNGDEEDGGNGDEEDGGNGDEGEVNGIDEGSQVIQPFLPSSLVEAN
jgi:hypothetical protein